MTQPWTSGCPAGLPIPEEERCGPVECESVTVPALAAGERGRVTCLEEPESALADRLGALGILPGVELVLVQRYPAFVIRIGFTEIGLDETLAARVRVARHRTRLS